MEKRNKQTLITCSIMTAIALAGCLIAAAIVVATSQRLKNMMGSVFTTKKTEVYMTPSQIESIRDIGQWEFLSINDEEIVDTTRNGLFTDDQLVRIYYGTLRIGLDLARLSDDCVEVSTDGIVTLKLPDVELLDENFIDEARTKSFHETGNWSARDRIDLCERARKKMMARAITQENLGYARMQAENQMRNLLRSMNVEKVVITFE